MIIISREEAMAIRAKFGNDAGITTTNRHKKGGRKKYYLSEEPRLLSFLSRFRNGFSSKKNRVNTDEVKKNYAARKSYIRA